MNRLTIFLMSVIFFISMITKVNSQEIYMNCKFISGSFNKPNGPIERISKDNDLSIILNKSKKTVKTGNWFQVEKYKEVKEEIVWQESKMYYTLNTINGNLHLSGEIANFFKTYDYQCDKTQKKF